MLLVKNGTVYLGNGRHEAGWDVLCDGPVIRAVGPNLSCEGAQVIDAAGRAFRSARKWTSATPLTGGS